MAVARGNAALAGGCAEVLAMEVLDRLHHLDLVAVGERGRSAAEVARIRAEMAWMVAVWRRLLSQHLPGADDGRYCPVCRRGWRRARWPCPVWTGAHSRLLTRFPAPGPDVRAGKTVTAVLPAIRRRPSPPPRPRPPGSAVCGPAGVAPIDQDPDQQGSGHDV